MREAGPVGALGRRERGAALVEMALMLPLLIVLLVGTITAGIAYGRSNSIQNAAREASRFAATLPGAADPAWLGTVRDVARAAATGDLDGTVPGSYICVAYVGGGADIRLTDTGGSTSTSSSACFSDGRPSDEPRVQVVTERDSRLEAIFYGWDLDLRSETAARYEREG